MISRCVVQRYGSSSYSNQSDSHHTAERHRDAAWRTIQPRGSLTYLQLSSLRAVHSHSSHVDSTSRAADVRLPTPRTFVLKDSLPVGGGMPIRKVAGTDVQYY